MLVARTDRGEGLPAAAFLAEGWTVTAALPVRARRGRGPAAPPVLAWTAPGGHMGAPPVPTSASAHAVHPGAPVPSPPLPAAPAGVDAPPAGAATTRPGMGTTAASNAALVLAARVASRLVALVTVIAVSRHLGAAGFGAFQTLVTYTALTAVVVDLGFNTLYVREGARAPERLGEFLDNVLSIKLLLSVAGFAALALTLRIPGLGDLLVPGFALMVLSAYSNLLRGTFYATGRLGWEAADILGEAVVQLLVSAIGFAVGGGVAFFVWAYAIGYAVSCAWFLVLTVRLGIAHPRWRLDPAVLRPWFVTGLPLAVTYVLTNVYFKIDVPVLQHVRPYSEVGWYTLAYRPFEALLFVPFTVRQIVFPVISVYSTGTAERLRLGTQTLFRALLLSGWPCTVGLFLLAPGITSLLHLYPESEPALRILALAVVVMFVDNTFSAVLNAMDRQRAYALVALSGLGVNLLLDLLLIPSHGYLGAATATVLTEVQLATTGWIVLGRAGLRLPVAALSGRILAAGAGMGLLLVPLRGAHGVGLLAVMVVAAAAYVGLLLLLRALTPDEQALGVRAWSRLRSLGAAVRG